MHHKSWLFDVYGKQEQEQSSFICLSCRVKMKKKVKQWAPLFARNVLTCLSDQGKKTCAGNATSNWLSH